MAVNKAPTVTAGVSVTPNTLTRALVKTYEEIGTQINVLSDIFTYGDRPPVDPNDFTSRWNWTTNFDFTNLTSINGIEEGLDGTSIYLYGSSDYLTIDPLFLVYNVIDNEISATEARPVTIYEAMSRLKSYMQAEISNNISPLVSLTSSLEDFISGDLTAENGTAVIYQNNELSLANWKFTDYNYNSQVYSCLFNEHDTGIFAGDDLLVVRSSAFAIDGGPANSIFGYSTDGLFVDTGVEPISLTSGSDVILSPGATFPISLVTAEDPPTGHVKLYYSNEFQALRLRKSNGTESAIGGGGGTVDTIQPYLELTNNPFMIQPVVLGPPVTITTAGDGSGAELEVVIGVGPVITSITVTTPGAGYIVGQRYRIGAGDIGGTSIDFEVATIDSSGELLTITDVAFFGTATNTPGTYNVVNPELRASPGDVIDDGLTLARGRYGALFNIEAEVEYDYGNHISPIGTEWNSDGWGDLTALSTRNYGTLYSVLNNAIGNNIIGAELVMHDMINNKYYKFTFTNWGSNNGGSYAYTRTLITDPNYFSNPDNAESVDIIDPDNIGIARDAVAGNLGIYNPFEEAGWVQGTSTVGIVWNTDGWDDLSNIETRIYDDFYAAYNSNLYSRIPGSRAVMYVPSIEKYYAVEWVTWAEDDSGGFSYLRYELDLTQLQQGITFSDGTILNSAEGLGRVKLRSPGNRRIEEEHGFNIVSVTGRDYSTAVSSTANIASNASNVAVSVSALQLAELLALVNGTSTYYFEVSLDENIWHKAEYSIYGNVAGEEFFMFHLLNGINLTVGLGDTVYYRVVTGADPVIWWNKSDLVGGGYNFRGAVIDYHAYTGESTIIGTIHIVDDSGEGHITHTEVQSGSSDGDNDDLWLVQNEGTISYRRLDGESKTLKIQWTAKVFYGSELYD